MENKKIITNEELSKRAHAILDECLRRAYYEIVNSHHIPPNSQPVIEEFIKKVDARTKQFVDYSIKENYKNNPVLASFLEGLR